MQEPRRSNERKNVKGHNNNNNQRETSCVEIGDGRGHVRLSMDGLLCGAVPDSEIRHRPWNLQLLELQINPSVRDLTCSQFYLSSLIIEL
jgi:hypothetical protein